MPTSAIAIFSFQTCFASHGDWKELEAFHTIMSSTFHPAENGNLQPMKDKAADLGAKAKAWQASKIPADYDKEKTKKVLVTLVLKCEEIDSAVTLKKTDMELKKLITEAHDIFHEIVDKCHKHE